MGLVLPLFSGDPRKLVSAARSAEDLGYDGIFAFDHFFPPGAAPDKPALEAFTALGAAGGSTSRIRVGTLVTRAALRPPGLLAKMAVTLDLMTEGRMILGIGTGDPIDRPEHAAFGFPDRSVRERRAHLAETLTALRCLFEGRPYEGGNYVPPIKGPLAPPPVQQGGPPIWIGAQSDELVRMAGRLGNGWNGWGMPPAEFRRKAELLAEAAGGDGGRAEATWAGVVLVGRDEEEVRAMAENRRSKGMEGEAWAGPVGRFKEFLHELSEAGATWAVLVLAGPAGRRELVAERVLSWL